mmetsp:Transcript_11887/g.29820  ORF Transcript_11887/g.29820 Transcript_11887/m.29820 type:complete len:102 (+) Transcript_11887:929-1234(+)
MGSAPSPHHPLVRQRQRAALLLLLRAQPWLVEDLGRQRLPRPEQPQHRRRAPPSQQLPAQPALKRPLPSRAAATAAAKGFRARRLKRPANWFWRPLRGPPT